MKLHRNILMLSAEGQWCTADLCADQNGEYYFENVHPVDMSRFPRKTRRKYERLRQKAMQTPIGKMFNRNKMLIKTPICKSASNIDPSPNR
jgi:hypothetical protein